MPKQTILPILRPLDRLRSIIRRRNDIPRLSKSLPVIYKVLENIQRPCIGLAYLSNRTLRSATGSIPELAYGDFGVVRFEED
jgi:hypothetical protein